MIKPVNSDISVIQVYNQSQANSEQINAQTSIDQITSQIDQQIEVSEIVEVTPLNLESVELDHSSQLGVSPEDQASIGQIELTSYDQSYHQSLSQEMLPTYGDVSARWTQIIESFYDTDLKV